MNSKNSKERTALSIKHTAFLALLGLVGTGIILLSTSRYGAGLSPDSVGYIATARHIANGDGVISYHGAPLVVQPPLYPALLATVDYVFGIDPLSSAHIVNSFLFGLIVYLSGLLFFNHLTSSATFAVALLGTVSSLISASLVSVSLMAWSEPLFICFMLLYLIHSKSYVVKGDTISMC